MDDVLLVLEGMAKSAEEAGAGLFDRARAMLHHPGVLDAGERVGEGAGRLVGALEGLIKHPPPLNRPEGSMGRGLDAMLRGAKLEQRGGQGAALGRQYAPHAAGAAATLAGLYALNRLFSKDKETGQPEFYYGRDSIYPEHGSGY